MDISQLEIGMEVRIICWMDRPRHWSAEMDLWQGKIVTIADWDNGMDNDTYVYIEEDDSEWTWQTWDFEPYITLSKDDPNILYRKHKNDMFYKRMKSKYKLPSK